MLNEIELIDNPTATLPLRLIHEYQCVPVRKAAHHDEFDDTPVTANTPIPLVTLWPPDDQMDRWIFAACGRKPEWYLGDPEQVINTITQRFGVGAGSLDESDIATNEAEEEEDEDEDAAVIRFVNEVVQKAVSDRATDIHFEPHRDALQIRYRIDGELVAIRVPDNLDPLPRRDHLAPQDHGEAQHFRESAAHRTAVSHLAQAIPSWTFVSQLSRPCMVRASVYVSLTRNRSHSQCVSSA